MRRSLGCLASEVGIFFFIILLYVKDTMMKAQLRENRFRLRGGWQVELRG